MADIIQQKTPAAILAELNADTAVYVLDQTGETLDLTNADGAALNNEANAGYYSGLLAEVEGDVQNLLPSPTSSHLDDMVGLIGWFARKQARPTRRYGTGGPTCCSRHPWPPTTRWNGWRSPWMGSLTTPTAGSTARWAASTPASTRPTS